MGRIVIPRIVLDEFISEVRRSDIEVCGLLVGRRDGEDAYVEKLYIAENMDRSPVRFTIDPYTMLKAFEEAENMGMEVIGVIHSHPAPPSPSNLDLENMYRWQVVWVIVDSNSLDAAAWRYRNGLERVELIIS